jgi:periplasmic protein TonB
MSELSHLLDVFSAAEIARAAGTDAGAVRDLIDAGRVPTIDGRFVAAGPAVDAVRGLRTGALLTTPPDLFQSGSAVRREVGAPLTGSAVAHALMLGSIAWLLAGTSLQPSPARIDAANLVYLVTPGPGGGGGGGGLRQPKPAPRAEMRGTSAQRSPVPTAHTDRGKPVEPKPVPPAPAPDPEPPPAAVEPPPAVQPDPAPPVVAPVATRPADQADRTGLPTDTAAGPESHGSGDGGGVGTGKGTGMGEGDGAGIGPGSNGGTGGGTYRPGSGVTPPALLKEVKPDYTEDARRRGLTGDVELEIVVRRDGSVGDVRLMRGLGGGLDQRAIEAVRQWRFSPGRRQGTPVDVVVEVAVEFKLR